MSIASSDFETPRSAFAIDNINFDPALPFSLDLVVDFNYCYRHSDDSLRIRVRGEGAMQELRGVLDFKGTWAKR